MLRLREVVSSGMNPSWLSRAKWSALKLYIQVTLNGLSRLYLYLTVTEKKRPDFKRDLGERNWRKEKKGGNDSIIF